MSWLVDGNGIIALAIKSHPQHARAKAWFETLTDTFHTCSVTEGTFLRLHMMLATDTTSAAAWKNLALIQADPMHRFIDDGYSYSQVATRGLQGHKQVTDAWLAQLARRHGARLATLDGGLVATHVDVGFLIPELSITASHS
ncbi:MAG: PIN domain-containing protein [Verrucomicrobia bacterium]|nr:PIN domain-containing protein [Verrucomicrobiota bacterium]